MRRALVLVHRWVGLFIAAFVALSGLTGAVLVWRAPLEAALNPAQFVVPSHGRQPLDPLQLGERIERARPDVQVVYLPLHIEADRSITVFVQPRTGAAPRADFPDEVFVDPYSGALTGERRWGDIGQGRINLLPFLYRLHYALAAGDWGAIFLGWVALAWTIDCFVGFALTLPARRTGRRAARRHGWMQACKVRWGESTYKLNFDLHRAGGLWMWPLLLVFAWSSVALNWPSAYAAVMGPLLKHTEPAPEPTDHAARRTPMDWADARARGRAHAAREAHRLGFETLAEHALALDSARGVFIYDIRTSLDVQDERGNTRFFIDAHDGSLRHLSLPSSRAAGDTVREWLVALHTGAVFGLPYRVAVSALGLGIVALCFTGVCIWWRKWRARRARPA